MRIIAESSGNIHKMSPETHVIPAYPNQDMSKLGALLRRERLPDTLLVRLCTLENGYFLIWPGNDGVLFNANGVLLKESATYCGTQGLPDLATLKREAKRIPHPVFLTVDPMWRNYYHWMCMAIPRIPIAIEEEYAPLVLPEYEGRAEMGWPIHFNHEVWKSSLGDKIFDASLKLEPGIYTAPAIYTVWINSPEPAYISCHPNFSGAFRRHIGVARTVRGAGTHLLVTRLDYERINPIQLSVLYDVLNEFGFRQVILDNMTLDAQMEAFANADVVIGAHGAGLSNLIACQQGTRVLELNRGLSGESWLRPWFYMIARRRSLRYSFLDLDINPLDHKFLRSIVLDLMK